MYLVQLERHFYIVLLLLRIGNLFLLVVVRGRQLLPDLHVVRVDDFPFLQNWALISRVFPSSCHNYHWPYKVQCFHGTVDFVHDILRLRLGPDAQVPLGSLDGVAPVRLFSDCALWFVTFGHGSLPKSCKQNQAKFQQFQTNHVVLIQRLG